MITKQAKENDKYQRWNPHAKKPCKKAKSSHRPYCRGPYLTFVSFWLYQIYIPIFLNNTKSSILKDKIENFGYWKYFNNILTADCLKVIKNERMAKYPDRDQGNQNKGMKLSKCVTEVERVAPVCSSCWAAIYFHFLCKKIYNFVYI